MRKKQVQHLDGRQKSLVEDALYAANPPEVKPTLRVLRPPLQEYIIKLLYKDLNKLNTEKVSPQCFDIDVYNYNYTKLYYLIRILCIIIYVCVCVCTHLSIVFLI